jgi:tetratricopeptide (TPR) repeat protein
MSWVGGKARRGRAPLSCTPAVRLGGSSLFALVLFLGLPPEDASGQTSPRPDLPSGWDTCDAQAYYGRGIELLKDHPEEAGEYFRWASMLAPAMAEPLYAWRTSILLDDLRNLGRYILRDRPNDRMRLADSLLLEVTVRNPFLYRRFEAVMIDAFLDAFSEDLAWEVNLSPAEVRYEVENLLVQEGPAMRAWLSYARGEWEDAVTYYRQALDRARDSEKGGLHVELAHLLGVMGRLAEARTEYTTAVEELRRRDREEILPFYESKALYLYVIGGICEAEGHLDQAREAFGQALEEDLSFFRAHERMAKLAAEVGDTTTALSEYRMAVDLAPGDPVLRLHFGGFLARIGDVENAKTELRAAMVADPFFAAPHRSLGVLHEYLQAFDEALDEYEKFLVLASQTDPDREWVQNRRNHLANLIK